MTYVSFDVEVTLTSHSLRSFIFRYIKQPASPWIIAIILSKRLIKIQGTILILWRSCHVTLKWHWHFTCPRDLFAPGKPLTTSCRLEKKRQIATAVLKYTLQPSFWHLVHDPVYIELWILFLQRWSFNILVNCIFAGYAMKYFNVEYNLIKMKPFISLKDLNIKVYSKVEIKVPSNSKIVIQQDITLQLLISILQL